MLFTSLTRLLLSGTLVAARVSARSQCARCGLAPPSAPGTFTTATIETTDGDREYGFWIPKNYNQNEKTPLILSYHGAGGTIDTQKALDRLTDTAFNEDHIVVYLQGLPNEDDTTSWEGVPGANADDIGFTTAVLNQVESEFCVDTNHIYATGKSQGGGFVGRLACDRELSTRIAAFAPVSGAYYNDNITDSKRCFPKNMTIPCDNGRSNIPILAFHGGADTTINYHGGFRKGACLPDVEHWITAWAGRDGLDVDPVNVSIARTDNGKNITFGGGLVTLVYDGDNIPHDWPATFKNSDNSGKNLTSFNATSWIMGFFNSHALV